MFVNRFLKLTLVGDGVRKTLSSIDSSRNAHEKIEIHCTSYTRILVNFISSYGGFGNSKF